MSPHTTPDLQGKGPKAKVKEGPIFRKFSNNPPWLNEFPSSSKLSLVNESTYFTYLKHSKAHNIELNEMFVS